MRNPGGYATIISPDKSVVYFDQIRRREVVGAGQSEVDTFMCCHCGSHTHVKPFAPMDEFGSMCRRCMKMTCPRCANGPCIPFEKQLEMDEHRDRVLRSYGI